MAKKRKKKSSKQSVNKKRALGLLFISLLCLGAAYFCFEFILTSPQNSASQAKPSSTKQASQSKKSQAPQKEKDIREELLKLPDLKWAQAAQARSTQQAQQAQQAQESQSQTEQKAAFRNENSSAYTKQELQNINSQAGSKKKPSAQTDETELLVKPKFKKPKIYLPPKNQKPKLAIIIDDVATQAHAKAINTLGIKITPSIFPPSPAHPDTPSIAANFKSYMIHLPMQAFNFKKEEPDTLKLNQSYEEISKKIAAIRKNFPKARLINNHTGSKFTSDEKAMIRLLRALSKYDFAFLDSRTTAQTKVREASLKMDLPYMPRDVFLDDSDQKAEIKAQLNRAINLAKKNGYAIAIGHPRKNTLEALSESKARLTQEVELIYLEEIYR